MGEGVGARCGRDRGGRAIPDPRTDVAGEPLMWHACALARRRDDVGGAGVEDAIENFVRRNRERNEEPDWRALLGHRGCGKL